MKIALGVIKQPLTDKSIITLMKVIIDFILVKKGKYISSLILALIILSALYISGCSQERVTETSSPAPTITPEATPTTNETITEPTLPPTPAPTVSVAPKTISMTHVLSINADSEDLSSKGYDEYNQFNYDDALGYFDKAIAADSNNYKAYNGKGVTLCFKGEYSAGMPLIQKALDMNPDYAYGYYSMAMAYKLQRDYDNSLMFFNKALLLDTKDTWSYYGVATIYADRNDLSTSLEYLKKAIELEPEVREVAKTQDHFQPYINDENFKKVVGL